MNPRETQHNPIPIGGGTVVLVGCSREKAPIPVAARALYRSERFHRAAEWATASGSPWFVLSGKHGLVAPDDVLAPYDFDLGAAKPVAVAEWARKVSANLLARVPDVRTVVLLATESYAAPVATCLEQLGVLAARLDMESLAEEEAHR